MTKQLLTEGDKFKDLFDPRWFRSISRQERFNVHKGNLSVLQYFFLNDSNIRVSYRLKIVMWFAVRLEIGRSPMQANDQPSVADHLGKTIASSLFVKFV